MAFQIPSGSGITGTGRVASGVAGSAYGDMAAGGTAVGANVTGGYGAGVTAGSTMLSPAIQTVWSKEILFQAMPVLRFEQFAVKKTELGVMPGLTVNFMRYNNLPIPSGALVEGIRMKTHGISAQQYRITVAEQGFAVALSELLLNASFDDVMASASRLLGRNMALYMDDQARNTLQSATSVVNGYGLPQDLTMGRGIYSPGTQAATLTELKNNEVKYELTPAAIKDAVLELSTKNIPRLGETYVCFIHPSQSRQLRDTPEFIEVTKYAAPGNFMLGEIGRLYDVVFIETTQVGTVATSAIDGVQDGYINTTYDNGQPLDWRTDPLNPGSDPLESPGASGTPQDSDTSTAEPQAAPGDVAVPAWDESWPAGYDASVAKGEWDASNTNLANEDVYEALMLGDNAFGHAISLPVELRDGGVLDFGREHALAWYSIWGFGLVTDSAVVKIRTNV
jgi:N4-gp56 family major capsid protein